AVLRAKPRVVEEYLGDQRQASERYHPEENREAERQRARFGPRLVLRGQFRRVGQQRLGLVDDAACRLLGDDEVRHVGKDRIDARLVRTEALAELVERRPRVVGANRREAQRVAALRETVDDIAEGGVVLAQEKGDFRIDLVGGCDRIGILRDPLRQDRQLIGVIDFAQVAAALADLLRRLLRELQKSAVA